MIHSLRKRAVPLLLAMLLLLPAATPFLLRADAVMPGYTPSAAYRKSTYYQKLCAVELGTDMRQNFVNVAKSQIGYCEGNGTADLGGGNSGGYADYTEYGYYYGTAVLGNGSGYFLPWCALFVTWCARMAGIPTDVIKSSPTANPNHFGLEYKPYSSALNVQPGDIVFLQYGGSSGFDHVGIVYKVDGTFIYTIDGNYSRKVSNSAKYYRSNGQDFYPQNGARIGYVAFPKFGKVTNATVVDRDDEYGGFPEPTRDLSYKSPVMTGKDVSWVQYTLMRMGYSVTVDGSYGPATEQAVRLFQKTNRLTETGKVDAATRKKIRSLIDTYYIINTDPPPGYFADVGVNKWYYNAVQTVYVQGYFAGTGDWTFDPALPMTRAMFATVLWRIAGQKKAKTAAPFKDVSSGQWYTEAVAWAYENDIIEGIDPTHFAPKKQISREQIAALLYRFAKYLGWPAYTGPISAPDGAKVSAWAKDAVGWATKNNVISGDEKGYLRPGSPATRAEVASIVARFASKYVKTPGN